VKQLLDGSPSVFAISSVRNITAKIVLPRAVDELVGSLNVCRCISAKAQHITRHNMSKCASWQGTHDVRKKLAVSTIYRLKLPKRIPKGQNHNQSERSIIRSVTPFER
jgi:ABC-type antimicrobial peptide transport system permease subunit